MLPLPAALGPTALGLQARARFSHHDLLSVLDYIRPMASEAIDVVCTYCVLLFAVYRSSHWSQNTLTRRRIAIESSAPTTAITMDSMDDADGLDATRSLGRNVSDDSLRGVGGSSLDADDEAAADEDVDIAMGLQGDLCDPSFIVAVRLA